MEETFHFTSHCFLNILKRLIDEAEFATCRRLLGIVAVQEGQQSQKLVSCMQEQNGNDEDDIYSWQFAKVLDPQHRAASGNIGMTLLYSQILNYALDHANPSEKKLEQFVTCVFQEMYSRFLNTCIKDGVLSDEICEAHPDSMCCTNPGLTCTIQLCMQLVHYKVESASGEYSTLGSQVLGCILECTRRSVASILVQKTNSLACTPIRGPRTVMDEILTPYDSLTRSGLDAAPDDFVLCDSLLNFAKCLVHAFFLAKTRPYEDHLTFLQNATRLELLEKAQVALWKHVQEALESCGYYKGMDNLNDHLEALHATISNMQTHE
ncbi:hypothetical protein BdWA1_000792 [Babesia duncani]|uniref:Uncharacterized protein n=1 Tax=Babesia duncani TaxID=323732 RepID=A0AAD9PMT5_9APIC|nr:hypothetical protein BdWA1_004160 [Babesia duncani]KAK2197789.1 hypothetical protein BdWA1_000792 [Babesia duncani]